jgi:hypothetical protein
MSDGPSTWNRRITRACFRTCSTCESRSQAHLYSYALRMIADHAEWTFARLRYSFGGDRPSQTAHLPLFPLRIHGNGLDAKCTEASIPRLAPRGLAPPLQSLLTILYTVHLATMTGCSKGARGLSVLLRVPGVFTGSSTSPD